MEFLKELFNGEALTYDQLATKVTEKKLNIVDISGGQYVGRGKFDDQVKARDDQIKDLQGQIAQRDTDTEVLRRQLESAQGDAGKLAEVQKSLNDLQAVYEADAKAWEKKVNDQAYEFAVKEKVGSLSFTSNSAKEAFTAKAIAAGLKLDGGTLMGFDDFTAKYKSEDPGAFVPDKPAEAEGFRGTVLEPDGKSAARKFAECWDSIIKPADRETYGWAANPWVWVIAFERCEKPEGAG